jgi:hypothetical protein
MLSSSAVDRGFISGVMVSMLSLSGQISEWASELLLLNTNSAIFQQ